MEDRKWKGAVFGMAKTQQRGRPAAKKAAQKRAAEKKQKQQKPEKKLSAAELRRRQEQWEAKQKLRNQRGAVILFIVAVFLVFVILIEGRSIWNFLHRSVLGFFGYCAILWPILLAYIAICLALEKKISTISGKLWQITLLIALVTAAVYIFHAEDTPVPFWDTLVKLFEDGSDSKGSGLFSGLLGIPLVAAFGVTGAKVTILLLTFGVVMLLTGTGLIQLFRTISRPAEAVKKTVEDWKGAPRPAASGQQRMKNIDVALDTEAVELPQHPVRAENSPSSLFEHPEKNRKFQRLQQVFQEEALPTAQEEDPLRNYEVVNQDDTNEVSTVKMESHPVKSQTEIEEERFRRLREQPVQKQPDPEAVEIKVPQTPAEPEQEGTYRFPPIGLLEPSDPANRQHSARELQANGERLVDTLKSFGVQTKILDICQGPAVTRYELQPQAGVKISKITNLSDDIALNLATSGVRIEAPIPNKAAVGIEVPNQKVSVVKMRELVDSTAFSVAKSKLTVALGKDIAGNVTLADLAKMPHTLIAGSTGSGKSVCINSIIVSLLYKATPDEVRFLMVDPKVVELGVYNGIPHLLVPVVTDPRKAAGALNWAVGEMLNRYKLFADANVRDLASYNRMVKEKKDANAEEAESLAVLPQIVIIIDELADLMMAAPNEVEDAICRLAQMARAAGMHLVIATQRPSVDVITGIIKANIPSRIAFAVSSQVDSRTILDMGGAEKLLGRGDMLFAPVGAPKPTRIQGCFVSDKEIEAVVEFVKRAATADYDQNIAEEIERQAVAEKSAGNAVEDEAEDPMIMEAVKCVVEAGQASTSLLQRRLRLGYARAGRLIDQLEQKGIVGPHEGSKPRQVLITYQQMLEMNLTNQDKNAGQGGE